MLTRRGIARILLVLPLFATACYESHDSSDGGGALPPGAYEIDFAMEAISGTPLSLGDDDVSPRIPLGFTFRFFERTYTSVAVSSNGFLSFAPSGDSGCCSGGTIPSNDGVDAIIAYAWTDLFPPGGGRLVTETRGRAPNRRFVLTASNQSWCCDSEPRVTARVILHEGSDRIEVHVAEQSAGHTYTQGVEDEGGARAFSLPGRVSNDYSLRRDGVLFITY